MSTSSNILLHSMTVCLAANKRSGTTMARKLDLHIFTVVTFQQQALCVCGKADWVSVMHAGFSCCRPADNGVLLVSVGTIAQLG